MIENINIIQTETFQTLVKTCNQIFAASPVAVRTFPHIKTGLCADEKFITVRMKFLLHDLSEVALCASVSRTIIIGEIKMCDSVIKCGETHLLHVFVNTRVSKIMP